MSENELHETIANIAKEQRTITNYQLLRLIVFVGVVVAFYFRQKSDIQNEFTAQREYLMKRVSQDTINYIKVGNRVDVLDNRITVLENRKSVIYKPKWYTEHRDENGKIHAERTNN